MAKVMYNGRMRKLYEGARGGKYVLSSGRKVYLKVKGAKKKVSAKHKPVAKRKPTKKKPGPKRKKKKSASGLRMPRMSNLKRFKLFGGTILQSRNEWLANRQSKGWTLKNNNHINKEYGKYKKRMELQEQQVRDFSSKLTRLGVNITGKNDIVNEVCKAYYLIAEELTKDKFLRALPELKIHFSNNSDTMFWLIKAEEDVALHLSRQTVQDWLASLNLKRYSKVIINEGYDDMEYLQHTSAEDLDDLCTVTQMSNSQAEKFKKAVANIKKN